MCVSVEVCVRVKDCTNVGVYVWSLSCARSLFFALTKKESRRIHSTVRVLVRMRVRETNNICVYVLPDENN